MKYLKVYPFFKKDGGRFRIDLVGIRTHLKHPNFVQTYIAGRFRQLKLTIF